VLLTNHVLSGALIGALARRPLPAFAAGVASHFVLDAVPHWGDWGSQRRFLRVAVPDGLISLAAMGAIAAVSPSDRRPAVLAGMAGAALPDIDKPSNLWFGWSPFPVAVDRFHSGIQREAQHRAYVELLAAAAFTPAALIALRRSTPRRPGRGRLTGRSRWPALFRPNEPRSPLSVSFSPGRAVALAAARPAFFRRVE
jgi:hypothetical protein